MGWISDWMEELAGEAGKIKVEGYQEIESEAGQGPIVWVTIVGAAEDTTTARLARQQLEKLMEASIEKNNKGLKGLTPRIQSYNKGSDLLIQCTVWFPEPD